MFEGLEQFLANNKHPLPNDGEREDNTPKRQKRTSTKPNPGEVIGALKEFFESKGMGMLVEEVGEIPEVNKTKLVERLNGIIQSMTLIAAATGLKPRCVDYKGRPLNVGNFIKCTNGQRKKVLELGYGYAQLSRSDDFENVDAYWFENEIKNAKFIKE